MTYDVLVFAPEAAPASRRKFLRWYGLEGNEENAASGLSSMDLRLQSWYVKMVKFFPPRRGPLAAPSSFKGEGFLSNYVLRRNSIYTSFDSSKMEEAVSRCMTLAQECGLGIYLVGEKEFMLLFPKGGEMEMVKSHWLPWF